jgi:hypothetical protein
VTKTVGGHRRIPATLLAAAIAMVACTLLTSCDPQNNLQGPVAITREGDTLRLAVCRDINAKQILISERDSNRWTQIWEADGRIELRSGSELDHNRELSGMEVSTYQPARLSIGSQISIAIVSENVEESPNIVGSFKLGDSGLSDSMWQHPNGSLTDLPCEGVGKH